MSVHGDGELAEELRNMLTEMESNRKAQQAQEDEDFDVASQYLEGLVEDQYPLPASVDQLSRVLGIPVRRLEAIEARLQQFLQKTVGASFCS
jgi:hypothetical protein